MNEQKNLFLAIGISIAIIVFFQILIPTQPIEQNNYTEQEEKLKPANSIDGDTAQSINLVKPRNEVINMNDRIIIETPSLTGSINLNGAILDDLTLKKYKVSLGKANS